MSESKVGESKVGEASRSNVGQKMQAARELGEMSTHVQGINRFEIGAVEGRMVMILGEVSLNVGGDRFGASYGSDYASGKRYAEVEVRPREGGRYPEVLFGPALTATDKSLAEAGYARLQDVTLSIDGEMPDLQGMLQAAARAAEEEQLQELLARLSTHERGLLERSFAARAGREA